MRWVRLIALFALITAGVNALPEEEGHVSLVPWKVLQPGETVDAPLALFWIPSSPDELRRSSLLTSDDLTHYSSRCVALRVVRFDDGARLASLQVEATLPAVVLADREGRILGVASGEEGTLRVSEVEELVRQELDARAGAADLRIDKARRLADEGDEETALALYRAVWDERCLCPRQGRQAQKAMRRLSRR